MAQHHLLTKAARDLPLEKILRMREDTAFAWFCRARWPETDGKPYCPHCGCEHVWSLKGWKFKCSAKNCRREFSATSGTIFASHKLSFRRMLAVIAFSIQSVKGKSGLQLSREINVAHKTAWVILMKLREAVAAERGQMRLKGIVEMDGMYIGGHVKPKNKKADRVDLRLPENQNRKRQCIMAMHERSGRTLVTVVPGELSDVAWDLVRRHVVAPAELRADEHHAYNDLLGLFPIVRNNHSIAYVSEPGASTNLAESYFSRVRKSAGGIHHHMAGKYLDWYVADLAWREDMRRHRTSWLFKAVLAKAMAHPVSRNMKGYWQGNKPPEVLGWRPTSAANSLVSNNSASSGNGAGSDLYSG
jgi:hypothetical protein